MIGATLVWAGWFSFNGGMNKQLAVLNTHISASSCKIWDVGTGKCVETLRGHVDEVLDLSFNATGTRLVTGSADGTGRVYNVNTGACIGILTGHEGEISKVGFNP